ncbi:glycosyltransferase [Kitasatospora viridis]|uniref:UDP:flavonoid glycosyltransferase YjiC (YdhE family) n=1 Tax=Kitasatospora viridis TaxID=281105 RepID=A0A561UL90_9ACTN|nr:glycosyltransferase [Kitasatospora viridis]TWG00131.1 UDP:flavonoid glycosyltransferase YjiC (YdhE family) [Kitasatospora viridis]
MRILVLAAGSTGDVAPFTGLGARLRAAGHEVTVATQPRFEAAVTASGLGYRPLRAELHRELSPMKQAAAFIREMGAGAAALAEPAADLLLVNATTAQLGWQLAEATGARCLGAYLQPVHPTREFSSVVGGGRSLGGWGNRAAGRLALRVMDRMYEPTVRQLRAELGLPALTAAAVRARSEAAGDPALHGYSPALLPRPADWRPGLEVVGTWWPDTPGDPRLPAELADFLQAGPPPVYLGFGSMGAGEGERLSELAVAALRRAGVRGVVQAGWAGLAAGAGPEVLTVGELPHELLFPRVAAVVQHGGAGTTAAALRAGAPTVTVPVLGDQPFWGHRVARLGAGPAPVPFKRLTAERLAAAVTEAVGNPGYRGRAAALAERLAGEDGAGRAVDLIEAWA